MSDAAAFASGVHAWASAIAPSGGGDVVVTVNEVSAVLVLMNRSVDDAALVEMATTMVHALRAAMCNGTVHCEARLENMQLARRQLWERSTRGRRLFGTGESLDNVVFQAVAELRVDRSYAPGGVAASSALSLQARLLTELAANQTLNRVASLRVVELTLQSLSASVRITLARDDLLAGNHQANISAALVDAATLRQFFASPLNATTATMLAISSPRFELPYWPLPPPPTPSQPIVQLPSPSEVEEVQTPPSSPSPLASTGLLPNRSSSIAEPLTSAVTMADDVAWTVGLALTCLCLCAAARVAWRRHTVQPLPSTNAVGSKSYTQPTMMEQKHWPPSPSAARSPMSPNVNAYDATCADVSTLQFVELMEMAASMQQTTVPPADSTSSTVRLDDLHGLSNERKAAMASTDEGVATMASTYEGAAARASAALPPGAVSVVASKQPAPLHATRVVSMALSALAHAEAVSAVFDHAVDSPKAGPSSSREGWSHAGDEHLDAIAERLARARRARMERSATAPKVLIRVIKLSLQLARRPTATPAEAMACDSDLESDADSASSLQAVD